MDKAILYNATLVMQLAVVIPLVVGLNNRKRLDQFGIFIYLTLIAAFLSDAIGTICAFAFQTNEIVHSLYNIVHTILFGIAWYRAKEYGRKARLFILISTVIALLLIIVFWFFEINVMIASYVNIAFTLILGLFYYYSKISNSNMSNFLLEPKFIIASAFILYCLSVMVIFAAVSFVDQNQVPYIWTLKQVFNVIFNIIIAYGLSLYSKKNIKRWIQEP